MSNQRTIAVTGASGFVGRSIVRELLSRGWAVRGLVRSRDKARKVLPKDDRLAIVQGDSLDEDTVSQLVAGASAAINTLGIIREAPHGQTFTKIHIQSVQVLVDACRGAGVRRIVHMSAIGVREDGPAEYQRSKWRGEEIIRGGGLDWTIFRPSTIHGVDGELVQMMKGWVQGKKAPWFFLPYFTRGVTRDDVPMAPVYREPSLTAPVAVEDVAWAFAECLERDETIGEIYNLTGPETFTWPELLLQFRRHIPGADPKLHPMGIPAELAAMKARFARVLGLKYLMPFDEGMALMGAEDTTAEPHKARVHLDFQPIALTERLPQYAAQI